MEIKRQVKVDPRILRQRRAECNHEINPNDRRTTVNGQPVIDRTQVVYKLHPDLQREQRSLA